MASEYAKYLATYGGMCNSGQHLGVFVGTDQNNTPPGWVFLQLGSATDEQVQEALDYARLGRKSWPAKNA